MASSLWMSMSMLHGLPTLERQVRTKWEANEYEVAFI